MATFHERLLAFSENLFQQALARIQEEKYTRANIAATASSSPLVFLVTDRGTPPDIVARARELLVALQPILSEIRAALSRGYGDRFLSGHRPAALDGRGQDMEEFFGDLFDAARKAGESVG
jgi:hypothetical protein